MQRFGASERQALRIVRMSASLYRYRSVARDASGLKLRIKEITDTHVHYGYRRVHVLLRREGYKDNVKRVVPSLSGGWAIAAAEAASSQQGSEVATTQATGFNDQ
jgi:transposase InsO family protein